MAIEAVSRMDGHEVVDVFCVTNATVESQGVAIVDDRALSRGACWSCWDDR